MRLMMLMVVAVLAAGPAAARNEKPIKDYAEALFSNMDLAWICREHLGMATYQAARTMAINGLSPYVGTADATTYVNQMEQKSRNDPRLVPATAPKCRELHTQRLREVEAERVKLLQ